MSGRSYTMKEMKAIVDYLVEHKAYTEIKGRKMWTDMADSDITNRTWQSLKETFLKRILPDIHNPYYELSANQIHSFKNGQDIEARLNNKLEIQSFHGNLKSKVVMNNEGDENKVTEQVEKTNEINEDIPTGEDIQKLNNISRDSTETLILENCYKSTEDLKKELQTDNEDENDKEKNVQPKSIKDLITYSEPLTTLLQNTHADFATDEESNGEPEMQIVESEESSKKEYMKDDIIHEIVDSDSGKEINGTSQKQDLVVEKENNEKTVDNNTFNIANESERDQSSVLFPENHAGNKPDDKTVNGEKQRKSSEMTQNSTMTTSIPNNQEALQNKAEDSQMKDQVSCTKQYDKNRKRASSHENPDAKCIKKRNLSLGKQSTSDTDAVTKGKNNKKLNPKIIEKKLNKLDETNKLLNNGVTVINEENEKTTEEITDNATEKEPQDVEMRSEINNPCLKSVNLYEEKLSYNKNNESQNENDKTNEQPVKDNTKTKDDIVILKSHSDTGSDSSEDDLPPSKKAKQDAIKKREKAMADVFGFSRGGVHKRRKRTVSYKHSTSHQTHHISTGSSGWTSDTGSEFISPPRGRKNRQTRKYLKPKSARILSLEEEGGLFVMYGKKIYPVVKDGKIIKSYVTFTPEEEVDQEESFWKLKYVEEKKRTDELTKLLKQVKDKETDVNQMPESNTADNRISNANQQIVNNPIQDNKSLEPSIVQNKTEPEDKTVKIKFTKNNEEVQLEGHWSHVNPILTKVMQILQKETNESKDANINNCDRDSSGGTETKNAKQIESKINDTKLNSHDNDNSGSTKNKKIQSSKPKDAKQIVPQDSRQSTPVIAMDEDEVKEKVDQIEEEIFKEIEEREIEETTTKTIFQPEENVTKRKGRPRKTANVSTPSTPNKKQKLDSDVMKENDDKQETENEGNKKSLERKRVTKKKSLDQSESRKTRSPKKNLNEPPKETRTRLSLSRKSKEVGSPNVNESAKQTRSKASFSPNARKSKVAKNTKTKASYLTHDCKIHSSPESRSLCSIDSTQGYQDSDDSPLRLCIRKKKRLNYTNVSYRGKRVHKHRHNSHPILTDDISESSNSYQSPPLQSVTFQNSTLSSEVYSSESYHLLMNKNLPHRRIKSNLEKISESLNLTEQDTNEQFNKDRISSENEAGFKTHDNLKIHTEEDSTSNLSLPTSPVLSIVENMSISKDLLINDDEYPSDDNMIMNNQIILNDFIKTEADVSMPLMEQECSIKTSRQNGMEYHYDLSIVKDTPMSETIIQKINTVNIQDPTLTDTINTKLKDLILESAKKRFKENCESDLKNNMEDVNVGNPKNTKKKYGKRSSTPRKRKDSRRPPLEYNSIDEHTESCSRSRQSCPPVVQDVEKNDSKADLSQKINSITKKRVKKDIIKVKITRPKSSKVIKETLSETARSNAKEASIDSESGVFLQCFNDSIDLIHNHSETCLNAHDCMGDSVEIVEETKSVISLDSTQYEHCTRKSSDEMNNLEYDLFSFGSEHGKESNACVTVFQTPLGSISEPNSLITEDLSELSFDKVIEDSTNKKQNTKWYLFSEDETTNKNFCDINQNSTKVCGSNLNEIFPITCSVPNLSTITEMSTQSEGDLKKLTNEKKLK